MCRLFGFRSNTAAWVHRSLLTEKNSLRTQSIEHPDGWGIAYYLDGKFPEVAHGVGPAHSDPEFERVSNLLSSHAVLAHVRSASVGRVHLSNAHPFTFQNWSFAHNGTLTNFSSHQQQLESAIDSEFLPLLRSETDSERCFLLFLTELKQRSRLRAPPVAEVARALARITELVARITDEPGGKPSSMNFLVTDGILMAATRRRKTLFFSARAAEGSTVPLDSIGTRLEQVVIASEELCGEPHWHPVPEDTVIAVDGELVLRLWHRSELTQ
jgi:predicted glutamine amidotransferase